MALNQASLSPGLPDDYQETEWIATDGSQYILLKNVVTDIKTDGWSCVMKARSNGQAASTSGGIFAHYGVIGYWSGFYGSVYTQNGASVEYPMELAVSWDSEGMKTVSTYRSYSVAYAGSPPSYKHFAIFAIPNGDNSVSSKVKCKLFWLKVYKNGVLHWDFVPCYRKSDDVAGLYDLVGRTFYTNNGTGTFTVGPPAGLTNTLMLNDLMTLDGIMNTKSGHNDSTTTWEDISYNSNGMTKAAAASPLLWGPDCIMFDGIHRGLYRDKSIFAGLTNCTIEFVFKPTDTASFLENNHYYGIVYKNGASNGVWAGLSFQQYDNSGLASYMMASKNLGFTNIGLNYIKYIAFVLTPNGTTQYVNGELVGTTSDVFNSANLYQYNYIGYGYQMARYPYGNLYRFGVSTQALTAAEIAERYAFFKNRFNISRLPEGYRELTYIESTGTQRIEISTWSTTTFLNTQIYIRCAVTSHDASSTNLICGTLYNAAQTIGCFNSVSAFGIGTGEGQYFTDIDMTEFHDYTMQWVATSNTKRHKLVSTCDETQTIERTMTNNVAGGTHSLFAVKAENSAWSRYFKGKLARYTSVNQNGTAHDLIPAERVSDGEVGLYDLITGNFLTNSGSGSFVKGAYV